MKPLQRKIAIATFVTTTFGTAACTHISKQQLGSAIGAAAGAAVGAQIGGGTGQLAAVAAGTLAGAFIGGEIGRTMDEVDRMKYNQAFNQATTAPINQRITWETLKSQAIMAM